MSLLIKELTILSHDNSPLLSSSSFSIQNGEILTIMGPSGCGKSTLLNTLAGHLQKEFHYHGKIKLNDQVINHLAAHKRNIGVLFQDDLLFPHLSVWENLAFSLPDNIKKKDRKIKALSTLKQIELEHLANTFSKQLSGGEKARISLIRMLLANPQLVLLDEPFSKLDQIVRIKFRDWVYEQLEKANIPTILVTHDSDDIPKNGQYIIWNSKGMSQTMKKTLEKTYA